MRLKLDHISCEYDDLPLFQPLNITMNAGDVVHLRGRNGQGKTTLLRTVAGLRNPAAGRVYWQGKDIYRDKPTDYQPCYLGHSQTVNDRLSVSENIYYASLGLPLKSDIFTAITDVGLDAYTHSLLGQLSAGQRRRTALAKLFVVDSPLWLLDEPFVALDGSAVELLVAAIERFSMQGGMVLLTSHQSIPMEQGNLRECQLQ